MESESGGRGEERKRRETKEGERIRRPSEK
jgi:hypothetical protein